MASEVLTVPEDHLDEVIRVIEAGVRSGTRVSKEVRQNLLRWCKDERAYLKVLASDDGNTHTPEKGTE